MVSVDDRDDAAADAAKVASIRVGHLLRGQAPFEHVRWPGQDRITGRQAPAPFAF